MMKALMMVGALALLQSSLSLAAVTVEPVYMVPVSIADDVSLKVRIDGDEIVDSVPADYSGGFEVKIVATLKTPSKKCPKGMKVFVQNLTIPHQTPTNWTYGLFTDLNNGCSGSSQDAVTAVFDGPFFIVRDPSELKSIAPQKVTLGKQTIGLDKLIQQ
jgi:hypothetical protein